MFTNHTCVNWAVQAVQQLWRVVTGGLTSHIVLPSSDPYVCLCMAVNSVSWSVVTSGIAGFICSFFVLLPNQRRIRSRTFLHSWSRSSATTVDIFLYCVSCITFCIIHYVRFSHSLRFWISHPLMLRSSKPNIDILSTVIATKTEEYSLYFAASITLHECKSIKPNSTEV